MSTYRVPLIFTTLHYTLIRNDRRNARYRFSAITLVDSWFTVKFNFDLQRTAVRRQFFSETAQRGLTLIFENNQMIKDQRLTLTSLTSHLFATHLAHIISSLDYLSTLISFTETPFSRKFSCSALPRLGSLPSCEIWK